MRHLLAFILFSVAALLAPGLTAAEQATLAGKSYDIEMKDPSGKAQKDTLIFTASDGDSTACHEYGFGKGPVTYSAADGGTGFTFTTKSEKSGTMVWKGTAKGSTIEGTAVMTGKDGKDMNYTFSGAPAKAGEKPASK
jgi:hypothetical protein